MKKKIVKWKTVLFPYKIVYDDTKKGDLLIQVTVNRGNHMGRFDYTWQAVVVHCKIFKQNTR
jgi:hypothetical protein